MTPDRRISINMPDLSPEAAQALCDWVSELAYEVERYYAVQLMIYDRQQREEAEYLRAQALQRQKEGSEWDDNADF